jgi:hypothetical protein
MDARDVTRPIGYHVFAAAALLYLLAVLVASGSPGPSAWGLHLAGFLGLPARLLVFALLGFGVTASVLAAFGQGVRWVAAAMGPPSPRDEILRASAGLSFALLAVYAAALWVLRTRTHFLGDGMIWLYGLREGDLSAPTEPLAQAIWQTASRALRQLGAPVLSSTLGIVSIGCGVLAAIIFWRIAREITLGSGGFVIALLLLLTMGGTELFCGYIESYPPVAVAILAYILAGLRCIRRGSGFLIVVLAFAVAVASHLIALYLAPSLLFLLVRGRLSPLRRAALLGVAVALPLALLVLLGSGPAQWLHTLQLATGAARVGPAIAGTTKPYGTLSLGHGIDIANAILLAVPVPLLLLLAGFADHGGRILKANPTGTFLAIAAAAGLLGALALVLPVAPAQDWDLTSLLLLPLGVFGIWAGRSLYASGARLIQAAVASIGLGSLLAFVLVNASAEAGTKRYETLIGPNARITPFARWYGYELLAHYYRHRGDYYRAWSYVNLLLRTEPANPRYWAMGGATLVSMGRHAEAIPLLTEGLRRNPNRAGTRTNLGISYSALGRYREALYEFKQAVRLDGNRPDYLHNLGLAFKNVGELDSARVVWSEVRRRWPSYGPTARAVARYFDERARPPNP